MEDENKFSLILGSGSPRRKELLGWLNLPFEICRADVEEVTNKTLPNEVAEDLALLKGRSVKDSLKSNHSAFIISSDTVVSLDGHIYGKPTDRQDAKKMLMKLSGKTHQVYTAVAMIFSNDQDEKREEVFSCKTDVTFSEIDEETLEIYLDTGESMDKAGSYGIQGAGLVFIEKIEGSYSNVVGFPLDLVRLKLKSLFGKGWRHKFHA